MAALQIKAVNF